MIKTLAAGAIGVSASNLDEALAAAKLGGFEGLDFSLGQAEHLGGAEARARFEAAGVQPAVFGVPFEWRRDEEAWLGGLKALPALADLAKTIGCTRCATWVMPASNDLEFEAMRAFHVNRFRPIAEILGERGIALGLEFVGPKTLRAKFSYEFVYTLGGMLDLAREIGPNVGLLLDSFHLYTSHGTVDDVRALRAQDVVYVHINDAVEGRTPDEQIDGDRRLPGATGAIDLPGFLRALAEIGYEGPVACEPFFWGLKELTTDEDRLETVKQAVDRVFDQACVA